MGWVQGVWEGVVDGTAITVTAATRLRGCGIGSNGERATCVVAALFLSH